MESVNRMHDKGYSIFIFSLLKKRQSIYLILLHFCVFPEFMLFKRIILLNIRVFRQICGLIELCFLHKEYNFIKKISLNVIIIATGNINASTFCTIQNTVGHNLILRHFVCMSLNSYEPCSA